MSLYRLDSVVLELGPAADRFLQSYTSQSPASPRGAFVDAKGRAVAVYDTVRADPARTLLAVSSRVVERLERHLRIYLDLTGTRLTRTDLAVYWDLASEPAARPEADPDGWRLPKRAGSWLVTSRPVPSAADETAFRSFRWAHGLALQGVDYDDPMLLNLADDELVSYTKGCYLGQEIIARVHYRGKPPLRMTAVREKDCSPETAAAMTSRFTDPATGEVRGFTFLPSL